MKSATYKLAGDVPETAKAIELTLVEAETMDELISQCDGENSAVKAGQSALDIAKQRIARSVANSEDVEKILKDEALSEDEQKEQIRALIQGKLDEYKFGARGPSTGKSAETKAAVSNMEKVKAEAANDPELAAKLAALGITL